MTVYCSLCRVELLPFGDVVRLAEGGAAHGSCVQARSLAPWGARLLAEAERHEAPADGREDSDGRERVSIGRAG